MYKNKRILGLIPARGGSKGIPQKNIKLLSGKPLIAWTIEEALRSKYLDKIVVSTDDLRICEIAKNFGAVVPFMRPKTLATSSAKMMQVVLHAIQYFKKNGVSFDVFVLLQPTSPLRSANDIDAAIELLYKKKARSVISVCASEHHPSWSLTLTQRGRIVIPGKAELFSKNRQELLAYYRMNGALFVCYVKNIEQMGSFLGRDAFAYVMPPERSVDIDTMLDFRFVEFLTISTQKNVQVY